MILLGFSSKQRRTPSGIFFKLLEGVFYFPSFFLTRIPYSPQLSWSWSVGDAVVVTVVVVEHRLGESRDGNDLRGERECGSCAWHRASVRVDTEASTPVDTRRDERKCFGVRHFGEISLHGLGLGVNVR